MNEKGTKTVSRNMLKVLWWGYSKFSNICHVWCTIAYCMYAMLFKLQPPSSRHFYAQFASKHIWSSFRSRLHAQSASTCLVNLLLWQLNVDVPPCHCYICDCCLLMHKRNGVITSYISCHYKCFVGCGTLQVYVKKNVATIPKIIAE